MVNYGEQDRHRCRGHFNRDISSNKISVVLCRISAYIQNKPPDFTSGCRNVPVHLRNLIQYTNQYTNSKYLKYLINHHIYATTITSKVVEIFIYLQQFIFSYIFKTFKKEQRLQSFKIRWHLSMNINSKRNPFIS